jgi:DNA-binding transcriptional MerR regulator
MNNNIEKSTIGSSVRNIIIRTQQGEVEINGTRHDQPGGCTHCHIADKDEECLFTIGELAKLVGVSVRTLQYYDQANLLNSTYTESRKRVYTRDDILKLQQILFLKSLGFPLQEINNKILKSKKSADFRKVFIQQREILLHQIANLNKIVENLDLLISETDSGQEISADRLITIMELMKQGNPYSFVVRYLNDEQLKNIANRAIISSEKNEILVKELFTQMDNLYRQGADPAGKEGQELARRWWNMVNDFTTGDIDMLGRLILAGSDIGNWPEEIQNLSEPIEKFLKKALNFYFTANKIQI